ncbi:MAG: CDP-alcohol phosphatidyltransferase family protein [Thomasclavelia sp.]|nr:CDP-alcohol phosphatidyltransferase family protein [Thomasclavelia sp.]
MNNIANIITLFRIVFATAMLFQPPFSMIFWFCYFGAGLTDFLDGYVARKLDQKSSAGAKLDSIADLFFAVVVAVIIIKNIVFPIWIWVCIIIVAVLRIISYIIGFYKYKTFASLHTYANKATGLMIFAFPLLYYTFGLIVAGILVCIVSLLSSLEELIITIKSKELNRDCKSIFIYKK